MCRSTQHFASINVGKPCPACGMDGFRREKRSDFEQNAKTGTSANAPGQEKRSISPPKTRIGRPPKELRKTNFGFGLFLGSNPRGSLPLFDNSVDENRKIYCRRYDNCIDFAISQDWDSFSCDECKIDEKIKLSQWESDLEGLTALLKAIVGDNDM